MMKTKRALWRAMGVSAIIALIGFGMTGCPNGNGGGDNGNGSGTSATFHTVTFDAAGGTPAPESQRVEDGYTAREPTPAPERSGYRFAGWIPLDSPWPFDFDEAIWADITFTARWVFQLPVLDWTAIPAGAEGSTFPASLDGSQISSVAYGNGRWVAVGGQGRIAHSTDGISWTATVSMLPTLGVHSRITSVAYGNGRWVAVGGEGMAHSTDGINWTAILAGAAGSTFTSPMRGVAYGNGRWVAVGFGGRIAHSTDGINWTATSIGYEAADAVSTDFSSVAYGNGRWVAVGNQGRMVRSDDGINWTAIPAGEDGSTFPATRHINGVAYGNGRWVATGDWGGMATSSDGINWTAVGTWYWVDGDRLGGNINVAYGSGRWVATGEWGRMGYSPDGINWTAIPAGAGGSTFPEGGTGSVINAVAYGNGRWVAVGSGGRMAFATEPGGQ